MKPENFGKNLKIAIKFLGITQYDLAKRTGLTTGGMSMIISGKREPSLSTICKILNVIPTSFERLVK